MGVTVGAGLGWASLQKTSWGSCGTKDGADSGTHGLPWAQSQTMEGPDPVGYTLAGTLGSWWEQQPGVSLGHGSELPVASFLSLLTRALRLEGGWRVGCWCPSGSKRHLSSPSVLPGSPRKAEWPPRSSPRRPHQVPPLIS